MLVQRGAGGGGAEGRDETSSCEEVIRADTSVLTLHTQREQKPPGDAVGMGQGRGGSRGQGEVSDFPCICPAQYFRTPFKSASERSEVRPHHAGPSLVLAINAS